jgi:hypothetical protein
MPQPSPQSSAPVSRDGSPMVTIVMSETAARQLAIACRNAAGWAWEMLESNPSEVRRTRLEHATNWLEWGDRWLTDSASEGARHG